MIDSAALKNTPLRILVADDSEAITLTFSLMLEMLGHDVRLAHDGPGAVTVARAFMPEVLMLDISLPGMNGYEVCETLRATPGFEDSIFIAQTGWSQPEYRERSKSAGFDHHLVKPIMIEKLEELLGSLEKRKAA